MSLHHMCMLVWIACTTAFDGDPGHVTHASSSHLRMSTLPMIGQDPDAVNPRNENGNALTSTHATTALGSGSHSGTRMVQFEEEEYPQDDNQQQNAGEGEISCGPVAYCVVCCDVDFGRCTEYSCDSGCSDAPCDEIVQNITASDDGGSSSLAVELGAGVPVGAIVLALIAYAWKKIKGG
jgi:hypothetical protein